jgi:hypothetical protein
MTLEPYDETRHMAYKNKFGITKIRKSSTDKLDISWDYDTDPEKRYPVLLFTPSMENTDEHFHITLNRREAETLKTWLGEFLKANPKKSVRKKSRKL